MTKQPILYFTGLGTTPTKLSVTSQRHIVTFTQWETKRGRVEGGRDFLALVNFDGDAILPTLFT